MSSALPVQLVKHIVHYFGIGIANSKIPCYSKIALRVDHVDHVARAPCVVPPHPPLPPQRRARRTRRAQRPLRHPRRSSVLEQSHTLHTFQIPNRLEL